MRPDVSVVLAICDEPAGISRAVASVLGQSLRNLELIVVGERDGRPVSADARLRYLQGQATGGRGAARNDGLDAARAPYVMVLDGGAELTRHACGSLLAEVERTGADFATGPIERAALARGRRASGTPRRGLYTPRRVVDGIRAEPRMFLDGAATNKLYRTAFLREHGLRFPEDVYDEDVVLTAAVFRDARRFAVVPWTVHLAAPAPGGDEADGGEMESVRRRVRAARLADARLRDGGAPELVTHRQRRFLGHDLRGHLDGLPRRSTVWVKEFAAVLRPYLDELEPGATALVDPMVAVCCHLVQADRAEDLVVAARSLTPPRAAPRHALRVDGRTYWGTRAHPGLDITGLGLAELPFSASRIRHEVTEIAATGTVLSVTVRTYDPFAVLRRGRTVADLVVRGLRVRLSPRRQPDGGYLIRAEMDLAGMRPVRDGRTDALIRFTRPDGHHTSDRLLVDPATPPLVLTAAGRRFTVAPVGESAFLRVSWRRAGAPRRGPRPRPLRALTGAGIKEWVYRRLIRVVPPRRDLALFESAGGAACTGNPKYVHEEIRRRGLPLRVCWSARDGAGGFPADVPLVRRMSWRYVWLLARSGYWVDDRGLPPGFPKPARTRYLQTWDGFPGPGPGGDAAVRRAAVARWDALVSPGPEFERVFVPASEFTGTVLGFGSPKCDVLVTGDPGAGPRVREALEIPQDRRILLYAPAGGARDDGLETLAESLAGRWVIVLRAGPGHPIPRRVRHLVRAAAAYPEVNDLLLASDALAGDHMPLVRDYACTGRPILVYCPGGPAPEVREIAPGPVLETPRELVAALADLEGVRERHAARYADFRALFCAEETGEAAARVVDAFFHLRGRRR
ncbi:bifunctional glycosyltransferase/CDP-glycerol:glycerophosphate glycerophosphotransferase [Sphaerisporangium aureirubrum]|uniref:CDP-glycerol glycerophosphotransferase family protein n=1 Tax=Sphaerisporangium aureirubrum TaxID=1544736 RepID=A0ABW1NCK1_9ACTN